MKVKRAVEHEYNRNADTFSAAYVFSNYIFYL